MSHSLILVAHGSRRRQSNDEVRELTRRLAARLDGQFGQVGCAFLELAEPSIAQAIDQAVANGATRVTLVPYFLAAGTHIVKDIPDIVAARQAEHTGTVLELTDYVGAAPGMVDMLAAIALEHR